MKTASTDIDPRLDALPPEGKTEYLRWSEAYHRLVTSYLAGVEKLKEIKVLDPTHGPLYDWKIDSLRKEAEDAMDEWQQHRRRILGKWLG